MKRRQATSNPREAAWAALCDYDARQPPWEPLLRRTLRGLEDRDRHLAAELLTGVLRHRRWLDHVITAAAGRPPAEAEPPLWNLLRLGAFQMLLLDRVPEHAAVNETVEIAKRHHPHAMGFVNAGLRAVQRLKAEGIPEPQAQSALEQLAIRHSLPDEIAAALTRLLPEAEWDDAARAMNDPGPLGLRFNPLVADPAQIRERVGALTGEPPAPHPSVPGAWTCRRAHLDALRLLLDEGALAVQDPASQLVALLVAPRPGMRVADLCAAPGGKAAHLAALMGNEGRLIVTDRGEGRLEETAVNLRRLGVKCAEVVDWAMAEMLLAAPEPDAILIDAPCSGWGTVRHKPDLKWRRRSDLAAAQRALLHDAASHLAPGGALIYSVCTFLPEETDDIVRGFLAEHAPLTLQDAREILSPASHGLVTPGGCVRTWPHRDGCDGFFAARMVRA